MKFDQWLDELNGLGLYGPLNRLRAHLDAAPKPSTVDELETVALAEAVWRQRSAGRNVLDLLAA